MKVPNFMRGGMVVQTFTANEFYFEGFFFMKRRILLRFKCNFSKIKKRFFRKMEKCLSDLSDFKASSSLLGVQNFTNSIKDQSS